jgi:hypothetical protein
MTDSEPIRPPEPVTMAMGMGTAFQVEGHTHPAPESRPL